ncbi:MAG TPA: thioredoxin domain-containing protein [Pyrinomonadaceae bacterium]|jgi:protein-disulfide isomerase
MKYFAALFCLIFLVFSVFAQKADEVLATAAGQTYTVKNLSPETQKLRADLAASIVSLRKELLSQMLAEAMLEIEAKTKNQTIEKLLGDVKSKVAAPTDAQIQAVYDANKAAIGNKTLAEVRPQIVAFLRREPEQKALQSYVESLQQKYKPAFDKDVNGSNLKPTDILVTFNGNKTITVQQFEEKNKLGLYEYRANVFDQTKADLENTVFSNLLEAEAKSLNIAVNDLIAREITDKMREFSDEERYELQNALKNRLYAKYKVVFSLAEPAPVVQNISADDDPAQGKTTAPVTVIMFSDFQCPACAATHPVLKKVLAAYGDRVRFVVRDFPLTNIHENAFNAAVAANAAYKQGKFFEYAEILYKNQNALDTASLKKYAADLGLNVQQFEIDFNDGKTRAEVRRDMIDGASYGINGTPTVFVNGVKVRQLNAESFRSAIEKALRK